MDFNLETIKKSIGESRTKESALKAIETLVSIFQNQDIEINKKYWVSEWSWQTIYDGNFPCEEKLRHKMNIAGLGIYATGTSCRTYFAWDLFDTEKECKEMCSFKDSFGYDWEIAISDFRKQKSIPWDFERCFAISGKGGD